MRPTARPTHWRREPWRLVPRWHWRYWIGYRVRLQDFYDVYDATRYVYRYRTFKQHADAILEEACHSRDR
jgi:hypothetical protein